MTSEGEAVFQQASERKENILSKGFNALMLNE